MSEHLLDDLREAFRLPMVDGERCVHSIIEQGSCRACVESCPTGAWIIDDEQVGIRTSRCDGCGLCVAACPQDAIVLDQDIPLRTWDGHTLALAACERCNTSVPESASLSCVNALGLKQLLALYHQGCRHLFLLTGDCHRCDRGSRPGARLDKVVTTLNRILRSRGLPRLVLKFSNASVWKRVYYKSRENLDTSPPVNRRGFFRQALVEAVRQNQKLNGDVAKTSAAVWVASLPVTDTDTDLFPNVPIIDISRCTGCDGCINACPHEALSLHVSDTDSYYQIDAARCTGCMICRDVCGSDAMQIAHCKAETQRKIPLQRSRCHSCGIQFKQPIVTGGLQDDCPICAQHQPYQHLFQVLEES